MDQSPVRIKVYGLLTLTRRGYYVSVGIGVVFLIVLLAIWFVYAGTPTPAEQANEAPLTLLTLLRAYTPWILAVAALLEAVEVMFVLRRFRQAEAARDATSTKGS